MDMESFLHGLGQPWRQTAREAWGLTLEDVGGWPLDIGLALRGPQLGGVRLLRLQAPVCEPGLLDAADLLHRGRRLSIVRFTSTRAGEVWLQGELPWPLPDFAVLDATLGILVEAATDARYVASVARTERSR
jgi:hypothetical protein